MRVLLLNQFYPPDIAPTGRFLRDVAETLHQRGHEVHVLCSAVPYAGQVSGLDEECRGGVQVHRLRGLRERRKRLLGRVTESLAYFVGCLAKVFGALPRMDAILSLTSPPFIGILASGLARLSAIPHVHWIMDLYPEALAAHGLVDPAGISFRALHNLMRSHLATCSKVVTLGPYMTTRVASSFPMTRRIVNVPLWSEQGLAPWPKDHANPMRRKRGWSDDDLILMYSGNMGLGHRFAEFLSASKQLGRAGPLWAFVGGGARRDEIAGFLQDNPEARVQLHPYVPEEELRSSLCSADVHLASMETGWQGLMVPSKLQGIFSVAKPVIFIGESENELALWIREADGGWVVPPEDLPALLRAIDQARDPVERGRRGSSAYAFARAHFDRDRNCSRIADFVECAARDCTSRHTSAPSG